MSELIGDSTQDTESGTNLLLIAHFQHISKRMAESLKKGKKRMAEASNKASDSDPDEHTERQSSILVLVGMMAEDALLSASPSAAVASSAFASDAASESLAEELEQKRALLPSSTEPRPPLSVPMTLSSGDLSSSAAATAGAAANRTGKMAAAAAAARSMVDEGGSALDSRVLQVADCFGFFIFLRCFGLDWRGRKGERRGNEPTKPF